MRAKVVHGSDWPIPPIPMPGNHGMRGTAALLRERNALRRDVAIKRALGMTEPDYWERAARLIRRPEAAAAP